MKLPILSLIAVALMSTTSFAQTYVCDHQGFSPMEIAVAISGNTAQLKVVRGTGQNNMLNPEGEVANLSLARLYSGWASFAGYSTRANTRVRYLEFRAPIPALQASSGAFRASLVLGQADGSLSDAQVWPNDVVCQRVR